MTTKKPSDKTRIEAAVRELSALGVPVSFLLELMLRDELKLLKMGKTRVKAIVAALRLPRENVDGFLAFPFWSPSLWFFLDLARIELLAPKLGADYARTLLDRPLRYPGRFMEMFVRQLGCVYSRRGRRAPTRLEIVERQLRAATARVLQLALLDRESPEEWAKSHPTLLSTTEVKAKRKRINEFRCGKQGMSWEQAAVHVAKEWADELTKRDAGGEKRRT